MLHDPADGLHPDRSGDPGVVALGHELVLAAPVWFAGPQGDVVVASVGRHAHERLRHEAGEGAELAPDLLADLAVGGEPVGGEFGPVEVEVQFELAGCVLVVALDHVEAHGLAVLDHPVDQRLQLGELVDVVAVGLGHALDGGLAVGVGLEPHHLGLGAGAQVQAELLLEGVVDAPEVAAAVGGEEHPPVDLLLAPAEEGAEHPGGLGIPGKLAEGLGLGDADEFARLGAVADVAAVPVDEEVGRGAVDELEALVGNGAEVLGRDALAHDPSGDGHELAVEVLDALGFDPPLDLGYLLLASFSFDEPFDVGSHASPWLVVVEEPLRQRGARDRSTIIYIN